MSDSTTTKNSHREARRYQVDCPGGWADAWLGALKRGELHGAEIHVPDGPRMKNKDIGRAVLVLLAVLALSVSGSQAALADPPTREPLVLDSVSFGAGEVCTFPLTLSTERNRQQIISFSDGRIKIVGSFWTRITNHTTGESIVVNTSGPFFAKSNPDGTETWRGAGRFLWFFFPGDLGPGEPGALLLTTGLSVEIVDLDSTSPILSFTRKGGTTENLCETLAN